MRTADEISTRIEENIENMIRFPKMWFATPESMELHLMYLLDLLSFMHEQPDGRYADTESHRSLSLSPALGAGSWAEPPRQRSVIQAIRYDYLVEKGYESNSFTNSLKTRGFTGMDEEFNSFSVFFKEFFNQFKLCLLKQN